MANGGVDAQEGSHNDKGEPSRKLRTSIKRVYVDKIKHKGRSRKKLLRIKIKIKIDPKLKSKSKYDCPKSHFTGHTLY